MKTLEEEFEREALLPEIARRLSALDVEGALALTDGVSPAGQIFLTGFARGLLRGDGGAQPTHRRRSACPLTSHGSIATATST